MTTIAFDSLSILNFKSFRGQHEFQLARQPGLYYIAGRNKIDPQLDSNGVGKSTIWDAFMWVLYGKTGRDNRPSNSIIPWGMDKGTTSISLRFFRGDDEYKLTRTRRPNELQLRTYKPNTLRTVTEEEVIRLLMPEEITRRTVVLGQFGSLFLDLAPEQQSRMFNDGLNLELYLRASKRAAEARDTRESSTRQAWGGVTSLKGRLTELSENLEAQQRAAKGYDKAHAQKMADAKAELTSLNKSMEKTLVKANLPALRREKPEATIAGLVKELSAARDALNAARSESEQASRTTHQLRMQIRELDRDVVAYGKAIKGNRACPECGQTAPLTHLKSKLANAKTTIADVTSKLDVAEKNAKGSDLAQIKADTLVDELDKTIREAQSTAARIKAQQERISDIENEENPHEKQIASLKAKQVELGQQVDDLTEKARQLEKEAGECAFWVDAFREIRLQQIDSTLDELEITTDRHVEALGLEGWSIRFQTERETKSGNVSSAFTTLLYPPGAKGEPIRWQSYSGGEAQRWQMATAFGLSEVLLARSGIEPNVECYDEPTKGLSAQGVDDLLECLAQRAQDLKRCIYVVEHHSLQRGMFTSMITVEKTKNGSRILEDT